MRDRLLLAMVGLTLLTIALYGVPRAFLVSGTIQGLEEAEVDRLAASTAATVESRLDSGQEITASVLEPGLGVGDRVVYRDASTEVVAGQVNGEPAPADVVTTVEVAGGGELTLTRAGAQVEQRIADAVLPIVLIGLGVLAVAVVVAMWLARRLSRPFRRLADSAEQLGTGRFDELTIRDERLPEARVVATALRESSHRLEMLVNRERQFAANVSHQLRTPLTAVRLRLDDLTYWDEVDPKVVQELCDTLVEIDRLADTITDLLAVARTTDLGTRTAVDLGELLEDVCRRWEPAVAAKGRRLRIIPDGGQGLSIPTSPGAVQQIIDVLLDNGLKHGRGTLTIELDRPDDHVRVRVCDEGPGISVEDAAKIFDRRARGASSHGEGIGLALAAELGRSIGGRLTLLPGAPTRFDLHLPLR